MSRHEIDGHENDGHENAGRFRCLNRSDDTEHCRMHGIVSETFDIS